MPTIISIAQLAELVKDWQICRENVIITRYMFVQVTEEICPWYRGPSFIQLIDELPSLNRKMDGPFIMPVVDKYKDMGTVLMGKVEAGVTRKGSTLFLMPNRVSS